MIVYKTTNLVNGKFYIGKDAKNKPSYLGSGIAVKLAIKKYGKSNFKKEILEVCSTLDELTIREIYWIGKLNAIKNGYNIAEGGIGGHTNTAHEQSEKMKELYSSGKLTVWNKGIPCTDEMKLQISNTKKSQKLGPNKTSYKSGKDHVLYGKVRDSKIYEKIIATRRERGNIGKGLNKSVRNIIDGLEFDSCKEAAQYYGISSDRVTYSCRKQFKNSKFRFK